MTTVKARQLKLLLGDIVVMYFSLAGMLLIRYGFENFITQYLLHLPTMSLVFVVWGAILYVNGLYDLYFAKPSIALFRRFYESLFIGLGIAVGMFYLLPIFAVTPKTNLFILTGFFAIFFLAWRASMGVSKKNAIRLLAVSPSADTLELLVTLRKNQQLGFEVVGYVGEFSETKDGITCFSPHDPLRALISEHRVNFVIVNNDHRKFSHIYQELYELLFWNVHVMPADHFFEELTSRIPLGALNEAWFFENLKMGRVVLYDIMRRCVDYIIASIGLIILMTLTPLVAILTKWGSPGPLFYRQERVGKNGKRFSVLKFRTMHALGHDGGAEIGGAQITTINDPRVTKFGALIRRLRIDELPQMINVLRGEMSIIGPRPERAEFVYQFEKYMPYYSIRNLVKPGLTGWAQINYPYAETVEQQLTKFQYDLYYIKNRSVFLDFAIIMKTFHVLFYGKGR